MICPRCNTENRQEAKYCDNCGYELPAISWENANRAETVRLGNGDSVSPFHPNGNFRSSAETAKLDEDLDAAITAPLDEEDGRFPEGGPLTIDLDDWEDPLELNVIRYDDGKAEPGITRAIPDIPMANHYIDASQSGFASSDDEPRARKRPNFKKIAIIILILAVLAACALGITYLAQAWGGKTVPDVVGMSQVDATYAVQEQGFSVQIEERVSDEVEGIVLETDPAAGSRLAEGGSVKLCISVARVIPDVVGMNIDQAKALLAENGFMNYTENLVNSDEAQGNVLSIDPKTLTRARADANVTLEVAKPYQVPSVSGMNQEQAVSAIKDAGFVADIKYEITEDMTEGTAIRTDPPQDTALPSGSTVVLYVAHNRSTELVNLTRQYFEETTTLTIDGNLYELIKVGDINYDGGNTCSFSITVRRIQTVTWFGSQTETRYGNYENISGTMTFTDDNRIYSIVPPMKQGSN